ncbi:MAG: NUDIX hydrolase [Bacteroidetes bacterium GWE2_29_8]|nr:MAG: NUDIX hydrolase [Bacteroidetes bacterium GWE2_29_8]OFY16193.1 MAG: NUDIX hydrolase [Bacteroidetes bacterium GWF2_29_10]
MQKVIIEEEKQIFDNFFKVYKARLQFEKFDGTISPSVERLNFRRSDAVAALIYNEDTNKIILINQFRYPTLEKDTGWITEIVAGMIDEGETPQEAIEREVLEEAGYKSIGSRLICSFYSTPGGSSERINLFFINVNNNSRINNGGGLQNEGEDIKIMEFSLEEVKELIDNGKIFDAKTIIALQWFMLNKN